MSACYVLSIVSCPLQVTSHLIKLSDEVEMTVTLILQKWEVRLRRLSNMTREALSEPISSHRVSLSSWCAWWPLNLSLFPLCTLCPLPGVTIPPLLYC